MKKDLSSPTEPIRLGILGAGLAVKNLHWPALQQLTDQYTIVQMCDVDPEAAARHIAGPVPFTSDVGALLDNPGVEAVLISLPIHLTADMILAAARAGKAVIAEKPVAATLAQGRRLVNALTGVSMPVAIAENYHFRPDIVQARDWIRAGRIGAPFLLLSEDLGWTDAGTGFASTPWRQDPQYRGAVIADAGVHNAAALRELGGEVEQIQAFVKDVHPVMEGPDTLVLNLRFRSGALGSLNFSGAAQAAGGSEPAEFRVFGREGAIVVNRGTARLLKHNGADSATPEVVDTFEAPAGRRGGYYEEFQDFYEAVRTGRPPRVPPVEALRDLEIILGGVELAESRSVLLL